MGRGVSYRKGFVGQVGGLKEEAQALDHAGAQLGVADKAEMGCFINIFSRFLLDGFHLEIVRAFDAPGPRQVVIVRRIGGECPTFFLFRDEIPVFPGELGEGNGDGLAAGTFQHGFLAVQPDEFCFQFFPLEVGPGAPLCKGVRKRANRVPAARQRRAGFFIRGKTGGMNIIAFNVWDAAASGAAARRTASGILPPPGWWSAERPDP